MNHKPSVLKELCSMVIFNAFLNSLWVPRRCLKDHLQVKKENWQVGKLRASRPPPVKDVYFYLFHTLGFWVRIYLIGLLLLLKKVKTTGNTLLCNSGKSFLQA